MYDAPLLMMGLILIVIFGMLLKVRFSNPVSLARDLILDTIQDIVIVLDQNEMVMEINRAAKTLLPSVQAGQSPQTFPHPWADVFQQINESIHDKQEIMIGDHTYELDITPIQNKQTDLLGRIFRFRDISKRKQAQIEEHKQRLLAETFRDTAQALNSTLDYNSVLERILKNVGKVVPIDSANIALLDEQEYLHYIRFYGYEKHNVSDEELRNLNFSIHSTPIFKKVFETGEPLIISDTHKHSDWIITDSGTWIRSYAAMPIRLKEKVIGFLNLDSAIEGMYTLEHIHNLRTFADQVAIAVENARLFAAVEHEMLERTQTELALSKANQELQNQLEQIEKLQAELQEQVIRDPLTGLYNRRYLNETLQRELARAVRDNYPISFVMIDIDHFKKINDTYGHDAGDMVLQKLSSQLMSQTRVGDIVCRYGGEEILVILSNVTSEIAYQITERWRLSFMGSTLPLKYGNTHATISCGISLYPEHGSMAYELIILADKAMYQAKTAGRNQVKVWGRDPKE